MTNFLKGGVFEATRVKKNYRILRSYLKIENFNFLFTLIDCFIGEENFNATNALSARGEYDGFLIDTDNLALNTFNDLKKLTRWVYGEATFLVIFDHLERGLSNPKAVFQALFSLLLGLRQQSYTCILVSGTLDAFKGLYQVLEEDMRLQLDNWFSFYETLRPLNIESVVNITKRHLDQFWSNSNFQPPLQYTLYPFGKESVSYLYDNTNEDIRKTLIELHKMIELFKENQRVEPVISFFEALAQLRQEKHLSIKSREINVLAGKLLDPRIQDKTRSTTAELAIYDLLKIIRKDNHNITEVKHEPPLGRRKLRPDIYIELFGGLTLKEMKRIGIEVKIYRKTKEVPEKEVRKTHSLVVDGDLDYVLWIITAPLSSVKHSLPAKHKTQVGRTVPLTKIEQAYLALSIHFEEIFKKKPDPQEANFLLNHIGIRMDDLIESLKTDVRVPIKSKVSVSDSALVLKDETPIKKRIAPIKVKKTPVVKEKVIQPILTPAKAPTPLIVDRAKEINNTISQFLTELSSAGRKFVAKTTIIKKTCKKTKIRSLSKEDDEQMDNLVAEIAKKKGLRVTPTRVYFS